MQKTNLRILRTTSERRNSQSRLCGLHVAHTCNLNCSYCFASQGKYHGERAVMSYEVGVKAIDFLIKFGISQESGYRLFGGEPLMNWDVVKKLVSYGRSQEAIHGRI